MNKPVKHLLRSWMWKQRLTSKGVAGALSISVAATNRFINGDMTSGRIRRWFLRQGCPSHILGQVEKKQRKAA